MNKVYTVIGNFWAGGKEIPKGTNFIVRDDTDIERGYGKGITLLHPNTGSFIGIYWTDNTNMIKYFVETKKIKEINMFDDEEML
jgi:hypothetical protein